jgi:hypothetical protein
MRVRIVLAVGLLAIVGGLALDMSGRALRMAGTDHVSAPGFVASVPSQGVVCQPGLLLPQDASSVELLIGTYGHPVPSLTASFLAAGGPIAAGRLPAGAGGEPIATGRLAAGAREGYVAIPLRNPRSQPVGGTLCLKLGRAAHTVVLGGEQFIPGAGSEQIDGKPAAGRIALIYRRPAPESWWQLLPTLSERFGVGKASLFGDWTLPVIALALAGVVIAALRLLARELA